MGASVTAPRLASPDVGRPEHRTGAGDRPARRAGTLVGGLTAWPSRASVECPGAAGRYAMIEREPMTPAGHEALKEELRRLKAFERPQISKEIEEARAHGDLSENAEYHAAREKQSFIEGRIKEVESRLALAEVIDPCRLSGDRVMFGATVTLLDLESDEETTYQIVGHDEADVKSKKISVRAPLARVMLGKNEGDEVTLERPKSGGKRSYEIVKVEYR